MAIARHRGIQLNEKNKNDVLYGFKLDVDFGLDNDVTNREHFKTVKISEESALAVPVPLKRLET